MSRPDPRVAPWAMLLVVSGSLGLVYEVVWMRRLGLLLGAGPAASALTVGAYLGGLGLGGLLGGRLRGRPLRTYAALEAVAAVWALAFPWVVAGVRAAGDAWSPALWPAAAGAVGLPAIALGATWPVLARQLPVRGGAALYAANTSGAVLGVVGSAFFLLPVAGVRTTEALTAGVGLGVAALAASWDAEAAPEAAPRPPRGVWPPATLGVAAFVAGLVGMGLEVAWFRLAALALGGTVQVHAAVLATFLAMVAIGAWVGRSRPVDPVAGLTGALLALGGLALVGIQSWAQLPVLLGAAWRAFGLDGLSLAVWGLAPLLMGLAPLASGVAFSCAVRALGDDRTGASGALYGVNALGGVLGAWAGGLVLVPAWGLKGTVVAFAALSAAAAGVVSRGAGRPLRPWALGLGAVVALAVVAPAEDARLFAVGVHLRVSDFPDPDADAIRRFADEGWDLLSYAHGPTGTVAVGRSRRTGNTWLSVDGKVDASTGSDMPTQELSGVLPVRAADDPSRVLVVGLASGVTAGRVLDEPGVDALTVVELEPAVVDASRHFDAVSGAPLDDPRTRLILDDARAVLTRPGPPWDVIVSEPSNPWISGVSNLFTREYWEAARARLAPGGVMLQWVQLYGLGPDAFRALVRTFSEVFPDTWLFVSVDGADVLLLGGPARLPEDLPLAPRLDPDGVRRLGGGGWRNVDDHPRVEWEAPRWLHVATGARNMALIEAAAAPRR